MAFFSDAELATLTIERMVFHLVGPVEGHLVRLEEIRPGRFAGFFIERIRAANSGAPYLFSDASSTRERLSRILDNPRLFQEESERLAEDFQRQHGGTAAPGAVLLFLLNAGGQQVFAILKYDDEKVLTYEVQEGRGGRKRVNLESLDRTFVQNRDALQKSALIRLTDEGGELTVLDRRNQQKVARYFENFLDAFRQHEDADLTQKLVEVTREVIRDNKNLVSPEVFSGRTRRTYDAAAAGGHVHAYNQKSFLDTVLGLTLPDDHPLVGKYKNALRKARIDGVPISFDPAKVRPPSGVRYKTIHGIQLRVPADSVERVEVQANRIIINDRVEERYDDADPVR